MTSRWRDTARSWRRRFRNVAVCRVRPRILRQIPHDPTAFTQGLLYHDGFLYESTGLATASSLRRLNITSGEVLARVDLPGVWAEGITSIDETIVQLTWKDRRSFRYSIPDLRQLDESPYPDEGWGVCRLGNTLVTGNGSSTLVVRERDFAARRTIDVRRGGRAVVGLNELQFARGWILANVLYEPDIVVIDPATGSVEAVIDGDELLETARPATSEDVMNGIAYRSDDHRLFLTGKNWPLIFEVEWPTELLPNSSAIR